MVVAVFELDLKLDPREERRGRMEDEAVRARREVVGEACPPVGIGLRRRRRWSRSRSSSTATPAAGRPAAVSSTWVETEQLIPG